MLAKIHTRLEQVLFWFAGMALFAMMALVTADVVARYILGSPITFQFELTSNYLMVMVATLALPWCERYGAFIRLTVVGHLLGATGRNLLYAGNALVAAVILLAIAWFSGVRTFDKYMADDVILGVIDWPVWLSLIWVPIGCFMLALRLVVNALMRLAHPRQLIEDSDDVHSMEIAS